MIIDYFTMIPAGSSVVEYFFAFDFAMRNIGIFVVLLAILLVMMGMIYLWKQDFVDSTMYSTFFVTFMGFICTFIRSDVFTDVSGSPSRLLGFEKFSFFVVILVLIAIYKRVSDA